MNIALGYVSTTTFYFVISSVSKFFKFSYHEVVFFFALRNQNICVIFLFRILYFSCMFGLITHI
jgi:hypothetical protein